MSSPIHSWGSRSSITAYSVSSLGRQTDVSGVRITGITVERIMSMSVSQMS